ncbi:MAG TPA: hypothetical protein VHK89_04520 [Actinomycetota bacterium]|jgi:heme-degrading monooxygenase HmoA|nr:hypothetical protein [Actinomycetota bacterium]
MHARVSFYQLQEGADPEAGVKGFRDSIGTLEAMEGEQGVMLLVDRTTGKAITITLWDTEDNLHASAEQANKVREQASSSGQLSILGVENYEVAIEKRR